MASSTGYDYGIRQGLIGKGVNNADIGYNSKTGYVTVKGADAIKAPKTYNGTSYTSQQAFNNDWDNYNKSQTSNASPVTGSSSGYSSPQQTYSGYNPYTSATTQNPYTNQIDSAIKYLMDFGKNQGNFDPYSSSQYKAAEAQAQRAAQQNTRAAQEAYGGAGFGRSTALGERVTGINNDATEYLLTQVLPQIEAQEAARRQQEYNNSLQVLSQLMNQQGRADNLVQQDFNNNLAVTDRTGNYLPQGAQSIINQLLGLKGQAEQRGITAQERAGLSSQADVLRNQLQSLGVDISNLGAGTSRANALAGLPAGQRTLAGQQQDLANRQANFNAAQQVAQQTGYNVIPTNDWAGLYRQVISGQDTQGNPLTRTLVGQQFAADQAQRSIDNNFRQAQADIENAYRQGQLSLSQAQEARLQLQQDYDEAYRRYGIESGGETKYSGLTPNQVLQSIQSQYKDENGKIPAANKQAVYEAIIDAGLSDAQTDQLLAVSGLSKKEIEAFNKQYGVNSNFNNPSLNKNLGGVLQGTGDVINKYAKQYGVDPALATAIILWETGRGTSSAAKNKNNVGGMMGKNGLLTFDSIESGIEAMIRNLSKNYISQGLTTIPQIQKKYAPVGASNDPTGLNDNWVRGVTAIYNELTGK